MNKTFNIGYFHGFTGAAKFAHRDGEEYKRAERSTLYVEAYKKGLKQRGKGYKKSGVPC